MIGYKLPNKTKSATVTEPKLFHQLNNSTVKGDVAYWGEFFYIQALFSCHTNPKYFLFHPSHRIFRRMHEALNDCVYFLKKKVLCKQKIPRHIKLTIHACSTKCRWNQKLIVQLSCTLRDERFEPNESTVGHYLPNKDKTCYNTFFIHFRETKHT
jgi:hypothetical protein